jgi:predicted RNase H-like HicB family nuclease
VRVTREYNIAIVPTGLDYFAYLFDLQCIAAGETPAHALANVRLQAEDAINKYQDSPFELPRPTDIVIVTIEMSLPLTQQHSDDAAAC